jgi:hypothetical protein
MRVFPVVVGVLLTTSVVSLFAQHAVDPTQRYHRLICLVHFTGSGTRNDPRRPEYVPGPADKQDRSGIVAWSATPTDDGTMVIIHVAAVDRNAFSAALADTEQPRLSAISYRLSAETRRSRGRAARGFDCGGCCGGLRAG